MSATSWGKILGEIGFYSNAYDSTAARARVSGTANLYQQVLRQPRGQSRLWRYSWGGSVR